MPQFESNKLESQMQLRNVPGKIWERERETETETERETATERDRDRERDREREISEMSLRTRLQYISPETSLIYLTGDVSEICKSAPFEMSLRRCMRRLRDVSDMNPCRLSCHIKYADLSNGGLFWKSLVSSFRRIYALSVGFKMETLRKSVF